LADRDRETGAEEAAAGAAGGVTREARPKPGRRLAATVPAAAGLAATTPVEESGRADEDRRLASLLARELGASAPALAAGERVGRYVVGQKLGSGGRWDGRWR
jgi:hypothetical protein